MKKIYDTLFMASLLCFVTACYDDKGNYDYRELEDVTIEFPQSNYSLYFGDVLEITPTVTTEIPEEDLAYYWEFYGHAPQNAGEWWDEFYAVDTGKVMSYLCEPNDYIFGEEGPYDLRLNVTQLSTGRHFYSDIIKVSLMERGFPVYWGAIVLHGDGTSSDIGIVVAQEFQLSADVAIEPATLPHYYSEVNGESIPGKGEWLLQLYSTNISSYPDYIEIITLTDQSSALCSRDMVKTGEWNDLFYGGLNDNDPRGFYWDGMNMYAFDGDQMFYKQTFKYTFMLPATYIDPLTWNPIEINLAPILVMGSNVGWGWEEDRRGFICMTDVYNLGFEFMEATADGTSVPPFNPADMNADLIYMAYGGASGHLLGVLQKDNGDYFMAELDVLEDEYTKTPYKDVPLYLYDLTHLPDVQSGRVVDWAFGRSFLNMCYYATSDGVYQFSVDAGNTINPKSLMDASSEIEFEGNVTMVKILDPFTGMNDIEYYMANTLLVVGTYGGSPGTGKLYSMEIEPTSGRVKAGTVKVYEGFDEIYDVNIKAY